MTSPTDGLGVDLFQERIAEYGPNKVPEPLSCPQWLCCLLPWLKNTTSMRAYRRIVADYALAVRQGSVLEIDARSLVPGDVIILERHRRLPADVRLISCSDDFVVRLWGASVACLRAPTPPTPRPTCRPPARLLRTLAATGGRRSCWQPACSISTPPGGRLRRVPRVLGAKRQRARGGDPHWAPHAAGPADRGWSVSSS